MSILLELNKVSKSYGHGQAKIMALREVNLQIQKGEFVAMMGPSGSGKTTSMNIMGCLDTPTSGDYLFQGVNMNHLNQDQRALIRRYYLGFVFQGFNLLPRTSALENVELPLLYRGQSHQQRNHLAKAALDAVGLSGWELHTPAELSGGQQQRVAIARAMVTEPQVLFADEPTGNLDSKRGHEIMQLLSRLVSENGITIVMVTHEPEISRYAERCVYFFDGQVFMQPPERSYRHVS